MNEEVLYPEQRKAFKEDIMRSLHCAIPGIVESYNSENYCADIQLQVQTGDVQWPVLKDVPVFMPVPFEVNPGEACLNFIMTVL